MHGLHQVRARHPSDPIIPKGNVPRKEERIEDALSIRLWACALALAVLGFPFFNPDVFWHLSAGRWIAAHGAVPRVDPLSFAAHGAPWIDFEWGTQLLWFSVERAAGLRGLWALKIALLCAAFWPVDGLLRDKAVSAAGRAGALALWTAAMLAQADLRADLASALFFGVILRRLESGRASFLFGFVLFAVWANLHAGFPMGFFLYALYASASRRVADGLYAEAAGALFGSLLNPYGAGLYAAFAGHSAGAALSRFVMEWSPPTWRHAFQIPLLAAVAAVLAAAWSGRRRAPRPLLLAAAVLAASALASARFGSYLASAGVALVFTAFPRPRPGVLAGGLALLTVLLVAPLRLAGFGPSFRDEYVARRAVGFIERERGDLGSLRLFNQYEWGGYLGWRMGPDYRVFGDGRYLFLSQLEEIQDALASPAALSDFIERHRLDGLLIKNYPAKIETTRLYPDGSKRAFRRPWYTSLLPRSRWALVYWDDQAFVFVDRAKVPAAWLAAHEYRWLLPGDEAARADALSRGDIPPPALAAEEDRHRAEVPLRFPRPKAGRGG